MFVCQYCGKEIHNKGCLILHEKHCLKNPNHIPSKTQQKFIDRDNRRDKNGKIKIIGHPHTDETKKHLSEKRKQWLKDHPNEHVWKRNTKFISEPCEKLKKYLLDKGINFVEEYTPFNDINYCLDIAWPDEKIAIEINGNQHYNSDGSLSEYYSKRHKLLEQRGWKIIEIHYTKCYNIKIEEFQDILNLPIYDKDYVGKYFSKKELKLQKLEKENKEKFEQKQELQEKRKQIIYNLINNSGINFNKSGWSSQSYKYLEDRGELWSKHVFNNIKKYYPEFLQREDVWKRKGSKY